MKKSKSKTIGDLIRNQRCTNVESNGQHHEDEPPPVDAWPDPPATEAYHGLAGDIVHLIEPASEADPAALLIQLLVGVGNCLGRSACFVAESDRHFLNEYAVLIGATSKGRKGASWGRISRLLTEVDGAWATERVTTGLSSGEGLIFAVRDPTMGKEVIKEKGRVVSEREIEIEPGVSDKRLLVTEPEFASVLKNTERNGNTLSAVLRQAWDGVNLRTLTKHTPMRATGPHVSVIGHITDQELRRYLSATEQANGLGNRFLWCCVRRSKVLPEDGRIDRHAMEILQQRLIDAVQFGRTLGELRRDDAAREVWASVYPSLSEGKPGLAGVMLGRSEAHVMRLACLYAVLDRVEAIQPPHLLASLTLWDYVERSVKHVFGDSTGDPLADDIVRMLKAAGKLGMTRTEISNAMGRHQSGDRLGRALGLLMQSKLARFERIETEGRPTERWYCRRT